MITELFEKLNVGVNEMKAVSLKNNGGILIIDVDETKFTPDVKKQLDHIDFNFYLNDNSGEPKRVLLATKTWKSLEDRAIAFNQVPADGFVEVVVVPDESYILSKNVIPLTEFPIKVSISDENILTKAGGSGAITEEIDAEIEKHNTSSTAHEDIRKLVAKAVKYKGSVENYSDLPTNPENGDMYNIANGDIEHQINAGDNVVWVEDSKIWDNLGGFIDLTKLQVMMDFPNWLSDVSSDPTKTMQDVVKTLDINVTETGLIYMGELSVSDLPDNSMPKSEVTIEVLKSSDNNPLYKFTLVSEDVSPYLWTATGHKGEFSGWQERPTSEDLTNLQTNLMEQIDKKQDKLIFDDTPTADSDNPVKSSGIYNALEEKANSSDVYTREEVDKNFANALRGYAMGNNAIRIDDSSPIIHEMGVRVSSKNLIDLSLIPTEETVKYGITYKYLPDEQCILLNGTATVGDFAIMKEIAQHGDKMPAGIDYTYSLRKISGTISEAVALEMAKDVKTSAYLTFETFLSVNASNTSKTAKNTATFSVGAVYLYIPIAGTVFDNCKIQIQLERGTTATDYVPYVDPASVTLSEYGKNLINSDLWKTPITNNGITASYLDANDCFVLNGSATEPSNVSVRTLIPLKNIPSMLSTKYVSGNQNLPAGYEVFYLGKGDSPSESINFVASNNFSTGTMAPVSVNLTDKKYISRMWFYTSRGNSYNNYKVKVQLELGSNETDYEPYKSVKTFTPSVDGTVTGIKNIYPTTTLLADKDNVVIDVEYNRDLNNPDVFKDFVKFTDYASSSKAGVVFIGLNSLGVTIDPITHQLKLVDANTSQITQRVDARYAITSATLNFAVKAALSDAKRISDMTDEEKANARGVMDAAAQAELDAKQDKLTFDDVPTADSSNPVKSGGIYSELEKKANSDNVYTKEESDQNFANAFRGSASGNNTVRIDDSSPIEHQMNVKVSSKNLIPYPYAFFKGKPTYTESGLTLTDNGDGTITVNGTLTKNTSFRLYENITLNYQGLVIQSYKGLPNNGYVYVQDVTDNITYASNKSFELYFDHRYSSSVVIIAGEYDNITFKPQLERGNTITDYVSYVAPSSITLSEYGKNLIPYPYADTTKTVNGITFTNNGDGSITIDGTATDNASFVFSNNLPINLSGIYTLSKNVPNVYLYVAYYKNNSYIGEKGVSGGVTSVLVDLTTIDCDRLRSSVQIKSGTIINNLILKPQLELGSTATDYEKYVLRKTFTPSSDGTVAGVKNIYPTTSLLSDKDNVVIDVEYNRDLNNPDIFKDYVKFTDYARVNKSGVVSLRDTWQCGLAMDIQNYLKIVKAANEDIDAKTNLFKPIVPANLDYAVRSVNPEVQTSLTETIFKNCIYDLGEQISLSITLPATGNVGDWLQFDFMSGTTATTLSITSTAGILGYDLIPEINTIYSLYLDWGIIGKSNTSSTYGWRFSYSEYPINA